ncbi:hypothetical protein [Vibrio phage VP16C]|nr:hypothetical protein [Vibrio phage VP16C]
MAKNGLINDRVRDINGVVLFDAKFKPVELAFAAAETWPAGAVLGRVTATGRYVRYNPAASDGSQVPSAILTEAVTQSAAGNITYSVAVSGEFRVGDLTDATGTALTANSSADFALRDYGFILRDVYETTFRDNNA